MTHPATVKPDGDARDQQIRAASIGQSVAHDATIVLAEYDQAWPGLFDIEATRIRRALGDRVLRMEHVGSTSVPGLAAKPRIDIVLGVADSGDEPAYVPDLEAVGYVLRIREPGWYEHRVLTGPDTDVNLHVFSRDCPEIERMVLFRNHLRTHDVDPRALRTNQAPACCQAMAVRAALRGRQDRRRRRDPGPGVRRTLTHAVRSRRI